VAGECSLTDAHQAHFASVFLLFLGIQLVSAGEIFRERGRALGVVQGGLG